MTLNFEKDNYALFQDWTENETKKKYIRALNDIAQNEKLQLPKLISTGDLRKRWQMNSRQSVHDQIRKSDFPDPVYQFAGGQGKLFLESEILIFEIKYPWIRLPKTREKYANWILKNVISD
ncbi:hypothetical protein [Enterococcus faecium]|jgi:hypothetical protein|uniref:Uncharacterized protein n=1 Tax=Enterococcus faecium TaxID=1352 RepID=A0A5B8PAE9_ENTFC|nr:hypothetical protein [Enterococcus faecium]MDK4466747.1 hypothetical protein [Enterococcus faecium]QDL89922.1 hypothetical protein [Enterococcus faecium]QDL89993.1 hypothetical protein [Enterococcus faecium]QDZ64815.1 hypothetical protein E3O58_00180 [Enterococcus faecium]QDZ64925.1 hypothetical protein E3T45_12835 [Enterococcus faecium]